MDASSLGEIGMSIFIKYLLNAQQITPACL